MTPLKAIKQFCYECSGDSYYEAKACTAPHCPLYPFRLGHDTTKTTRKMTDEQRAAAAARLKAAREKKKENERSTT